MQALTISLLMSLWPCRPTDFGLLAGPDALGAGAFLPNTIKLETFQHYLQIAVRSWQQKSTLILFGYPIVNANSLIENCRNAKQLKNII